MSEWAQSTIEVSTAGGYLCPALVPQPRRKYGMHQLMVDGQLLDAIEDEVQSGGRIIDWHACEVFPRSWVDLVVVLRTDGTVLFDRLVGRYVWVSVRLWDGGLDDAFGMMRWLRRG